MTDLVYENGGIYHPDGTPYRGPTGRIPVSPLPTGSEIYHWSGTGEYRPDRKDADVTSSEHELKIRVVPVVDEDKMAEAINALSELRAGLKRMSDAFAEAVRVLEDGDTDTPDGQDTYDPHADILLCADTDTGTWPQDVVRVLCHVPGHGWGGTHHHVWADDRSGHDWICPGD